MKKALLLGNGLNRLSGDYSWEKLIEDLLEDVGPPNPPNAKGKPFPLFYEQIVQVVGKIKKKDSELKNRIAKLVEKIEPNSLHSRLSHLDVSEILTTNYDYNIEASCWSEENGEEKGGIVRESRYSLFRRKTYPGVDVWHIHGETSNPETILLGYEQYAGYLQAMRNYMTKGRKQDGIEPLFDRIGGDEPIDQGHSWLDFFFNRDLFILGFTMDYVEMHLWWLITYRARLQSEYGFQLRNNIAYIFPEFIRKDIIPRCELLDAAKIELTPIETKKKRDWAGFYDQALSYVKNT